MLRVLFDSQIFGIQVFGGISRYYHELIRHLARHENLDIRIRIRYSNNSYIEGDGLFPHRRCFPQYRIPGKHALMARLNQSADIQSIRNGNYDIFHPTYYSPYFLKWIGHKPFVLTVYDMIHERFDELRNADRGIPERKRLLAGLASRIIAISENTRADLVRYFGIDPGKIDVIHLAASACTPATAGETTYPFLPKKYLLFVGARTYYKNFQNFLRSVAPLLHQDEHMDVVCAGGGEFTPGENTLFGHLRILGRVHRYSAPDSMLWHLYRNATAFVFPSLYEGFGIPVLEAFACGCPIAVSDTSSLPEIAGDASLYFDPLDEASIRSAVERIAYDKNLRERLVQKGFLRVREFSWEKTALETIQSYESIR